MRIVLTKRTRLRVLLATVVVLGASACGTTTDPDTEPSGAVLAETDDRPGVHGEAFAEDAAVFGCEDGAVVDDGRDITKVSSPDG